MRLTWAANVRTSDNRMRKRTLRRPIIIVGLICTLCDNTLDHYRTFSGLCLLLLVMHLSVVASLLVLNILLMFSLVLRRPHLLLLSKSRRTRVEIGGIRLGHRLLLLPLLRVRTVACLSLASGKERAVLHLLTGGEM